MQQVQLLGVEFGPHQIKAGQVPAGPRQAGGEANRYRIRPRPHDDRNPLSRFARDDCGVAAIRHDNVDRQGHQLGCQLWEKRDIAAVRTEFEDDVAALDVTQFEKALSERLENRRFIVIRGRQNTDARDLRRGLPGEDRIVVMSEEDANCLIPAGWILLTEPPCDAG